MMKVTPIFAYLDPGSGSLILQMAIGAIAAFLFTIKTYWIKITGFFTRKREKSDSDKKA